MGNYAHATESKVYIGGIGQLRNDGGFQIMQRTSSIGGEFGSRPGRQSGFGQDDNCCTKVASYFRCCGSNGPEKERKMPMRIEPKVYFANERTFLSWLHTAVTLGGIGGALIGFGGAKMTAGVKSVDTVGSIIGCIMVTVSILMIICKSLWSETNDIILSCFVTNLAKLASHLTNLQTQCVPSTGA